MVEKYYKILGLSSNCDDGDIKRAYKKLALKYHPDRNKGDSFAEEKFKEINEAYNFLKVKENRVKLSNSSVFAEDDDLFSKSIDDLRAKGKNVKTFFYLEDLPDYTTVTYTHKIICPTCKGFKGLRLDSVTCKKCNGVGIIMTNSGASVCTDCSGFRLTPKHLCETCKGTGMVEEEVERDIKQYLSNKQVNDEIKIEGGGDASSTLGPNGDLIVKLI